MINNLLEILPYKVFARLYYYYFQRDKNKFYNFLVKEKKYKELQSLDLSSHKTSNKLFIIGSGYSLNNITQNQWKQINSHDTFGFNFSFLNTDHVPTFYSCEAAKQTIPANGEKSITDLFGELYKSRRDVYKNVVKFVTDLEPSRLEHFESYGKEILEDNLFLVNTVNGIARNKSEFLSLVNYYLKKGLFQKKSNLKEIFKFRATLSMAVSFAINLGYEEIILCGIDLNDPRYFYHNTSKYPSIPEFRVPVGNKKHGTITSNKLMIAIDEIIDVFNTEICKQMNVSLFIQNPESALSSILPIYKFENDEA
jgi:hypothetical protein